MTADLLSSACLEMRVHIFLIPSMNSIENHSSPAVKKGKEKTQAAKDVQYQCMSISEFTSIFAVTCSASALYLVRYIDEKPNHWHSDHLITVKEIEDENKLKMAVYCMHTMNFQDLREKNKRRTELVMEIKKIFEELNVKYTLLR